MENNDFTRWFLLTTDQCCNVLRAGLDYLVPAPLKPDLELDELPRSLNLERPRTVSHSDIDTARASQSIDIPKH